ncbi:hypothetical protein [Streptomyces virginiae]|uniref:hypothetical protein n=1 Tax=Streptomyces virginiae TaxID=1961 RepID=UPI003654C309
MGTDSIRILPTYRTPDGRHWLHPSHHTQLTALPQHVDAADRHTIRRLMNATIPVNSQWLDQTDPVTAHPANRSAVPGLRDLALLPQPVSRTTVKPYRGRGRSILSTDRLALLIRGVHE